MAYSGSMAMRSLFPLPSRTNARDSGGPIEPAARGAKGANDCEPTTQCLSPLGRGRNLAPARLRVRGLGRRIEPLNRFVRWAGKPPSPQRGEGQEGWLTRCHCCPYDSRLVCGFYRTEKARGKNSGKWRIEQMLRLPLHFFNMEPEF